MCASDVGGKIAGMAPKFTMDAAETQSGLSSSDAAAAAQQGSSIGSVWIGGYTTPLVGALLGARAVSEAKTEGRVAVNAVSREVSVTTVEGAEAANSGALTT